MTRREKKAKKGKLPADLTKRVRAMDRAKLLLLLAYLKILLHVKRGSKGKKTQGKSTHHLKPGVHNVRIKGKMRKVRVLQNGKWRFLKG